MKFNEWRWETHGPFTLTAAVLRSLAPDPIGRTWERNIRREDSQRQKRAEYPIPSIFE